MIVKIERDGYNVRVNGVVCPVNKQASKGEGHEVVDISKVGGEACQKWLSLSMIPDGETCEIELKPRKVVEAQKFVLTDDEKAQVAELQAQIDAIISAAKQRYVPTHTKDIRKMSIEELEAYIAAKKASIA